MHETLRHVLQTRCGSQLCATRQGSATVKFSTVCLLISIWDCARGVAAATSANAISGSSQCHEALDRVASACGEFDAETGWFCTSPACLVELKLFDEQRSVHACNRFLASSLRKVRASCDIAGKPVAQLNAGGSVHLLGDNTNISSPADLFDVDEDGFLTGIELAHFCAHNFDIVDVADVAESTIAEAIKHFDANGDDKISSNEAASYFTKFLNMEKHGEYGMDVEIQAMVDYGLRSMAISKKPTIDCTQAAAWVQERSKRLGLYLQTCGSSDGRRTHGDL